MALNLIQLQSLSPGFDFNLCEQSHRPQESLDMLRCASLTEFTLTQVREKCTISKLARQGTPKPQRPLKSELCHVTSEELLNRHFIPFPFVSMHII